MQYNAPYYECLLGSLFIFSVDLINAGCPSLSHDALSMRRISDHEISDPHQIVSTQRLRFYIRSHET